MSNDETICSLFQKRVEEDPHRVAIHCRGENTTYGQLAKDANGIASWLQSIGVSRGDRVVLLLANSSEYVASYLGILQAGGIVVALNPETTPHELDYVLADADPKVAMIGQDASRISGRCFENASSQCLAILTDDVKEDFQTTLSHAIRHSEVRHFSSECETENPQLDDHAQIIYTSGTTGKPKGVLLSHRNLSANCDSIVDYLQLTSTDSVMVVLPFFYSYGNSLLITHLSVGAKLVLSADTVFWNRVLDTMQSEKVTGFSGVPSTFAMLMHRSDFMKRDFLHLRYLTCAGGGLAPSVAERIRETHSQVDLFPMYGQTEATARLSTLLPHEIEFKPGSIGRGIEGVRLLVLNKENQEVSPGEVGEITASGENIMCGYWNDEVASKQVLTERGLRTGDMARVDEDGYIYIVGRKTDMIKYGSYRINPQEIEEVILELPEVAEVAVVGIPDEIWGESPVAFVVFSNVSNAVDSQAIVKHCRKKLPRYKQIKKVVSVESLPKTSSGKIRRHKLQAEFEAAILDDF